MVLAAEQMGRTKDIKNITAFYREWKWSSHYKIYLHHKKIIPTNTASSL